MGNRSRSKLEIIFSTRLLSFCFSRDSYLELKFRHLTFAHVIHSDLISKFCSKNFQKFQINFKIKQYYNKMPLTNIDRAYRKSRVDVSRWHFQKTISILILDAIKKRLYDVINIANYYSNIDGF